MAPKVSKKPIIKEIIIVPPDENKLSFIDKEFFKIQFEAKENIIARLNNTFINLEKDTVKYKKKANNLNTILKNEYSDSKKILEENCNVEKILKTEIADLLQEKGSMVQICRNRLKEKDNEFMKEAGVIKSIIAVYVGKINKLDEYCIQEEMLEEKLVNMKQQFEYMDINHEEKLKNLEEEYIYNKKLTHKQLLKRCNKIAFVINKQLMLNLPRSVKERTKDIFSLEDVLKTLNKQNIDIENIVPGKNEENKHFITQIKSNKIKINTINNDYITKNGNVKVLKKELAEMLNDVNKLSRNLDSDMERTQQKNQKLGSDIDYAVHELQALNYDVQACQEKLFNIRDANEKLDEIILNMGDVLLSIYREVLNHVEEVKFSNKENEDYNEKTKEFIRQLYEELEPFITISEEICHEKS